MIPENPTFPLEDWQYEVANGDTRLGYSDWLHHRIEANATYQLETRLEDGTKLVNDGSGWKEP